MAEMNDVAIILQDDYGWTWNDNGLMTAPTGQHYDPEAREFVSQSVFDQRSQPAADTSSSIYDGPVVNPGYDGTLDTNGDGAISLEEQGMMSSPAAQNDYYVDVMSGGVYERGEDGSVNTSTQDPVYTYNAADQSWTSSSAGSGATAVNTNAGSSGSASAAQPQTIVQQIDTSGLATTSGMNQGFNNVLGDTGNILSDTNQIKTDVGQVQSDVNQGFADVGGQLTGLGTQIGNAEQNLTGQMSDLSGNVTEGFANFGNTLGTGFTGLYDNMNDQFATQNNNLTDMSANILGGQTNLQDYLEGMSGRADTYYGGLAEGQSNIMGEVGGLQSGFSDFRKTYDDNTTMANQTRNQLIDQVVGGFGAQEQAQSEYNTAAQKERADISASIAQQAQAAPQTAASYAPAIRDIASGIAPTTMEQEQAQANARGRLAAAKQMVATVGQNLSPELRMQYETLATSFDDNGRLIPLSTDQAGNRTQRAMDNQSNLLATTINTANQVTDQRAVNVDRLLAYMDQLGYSGGQGTGQLTTNNTGLMGPAVNTFG